MAEGRRKLKKQPRSSACQQPRRGAQRLNTSEEKGAGNTSPRCGDSDRPTGSAECLRRSYFRPRAPPGAQRAPERADLSSALTGSHLGNWRGHRDGGQLVYRIEKTSLDRRTPCLARPFSLASAESRLGNPRFFQPRNCGQHNEIRKSAKSCLKCRLCTFEIDSRSYLS